MSFAFAVSKDRPDPWSFIMMHVVVTGIKVWSFLKDDLQIAEMKCEQYMPSYDNTLMVARKRRRGRRGGRSSV